MRGREERRGEGQQWEEERIGEKRQRRGECEGKGKKR